jgi:hypothetical protein
MDTLKVVSGFLLLLAGSQVYWFALVVSGLIVGDLITSQSFDFELSFPAFSNSIKYSLLGLVLSITAKPLAALASGFILGGFLSYHLPAVLGIDMDWYSWPYFIAAGILVVALLLLFYAYSYILVTALSGAILIAENIQIASLDNNLMLLLLFMVGLATQYMLLNYNSPVLD